MANSKDSKRKKFKEKLRRGGKRSDSADRWDLVIWPLTNAYTILAGNELSCPKSALGRNLWRQRNLQSLVDLACSPRYNPFICTVPYHPPLRLQEPSSNSSSWYSHLISYAMLSALANNSLHSTFKGQPCPARHRCVWLFETSKSALMTLVMERAINVSTEGQRRHSCRIKK